jgi:hypothetical protein
MLLSKTRVEYEVFKAQSTHHTTRFAMKGVPMLNSIPIGLPKTPSILRGAEQERARYEAAAASAGRRRRLIWRMRLLRRLTAAFRITPARRQVCQPC